MSEARTNRAAAVELKSVAIAGAEVVTVLTEWREFRELDPREVSTWTDARTIIDGRNCLDAGAWRAAGWTYHGLGRP